MDEYLRSLDVLPGERGITKRRRRELVQKVETDKLLCFRASSIELPDGRRIRMDGQLSIHLYQHGVLSDDTPLLLEIFEGEDEDDAQDLYCQYDHARSYRNNAQVTNAWARRYPELNACTRMWDPNTLLRGVAASVKGTYTNGASRPSPLLPD
jgi:hypothetical protein